MFGNIYQFLEYRKIQAAPLMETACIFLARLFVILSTPSLP